MKKALCRIGLMIVFLLFIIISNPTIICQSNNVLPKNYFLYNSNHCDYNLQIQGLMNSSWPMKCHDLQHTGQSQYSTENNPPGVIKWEYETGGWIQDSPVIARDGTIYVGSSDFKLYAINPDGTLKWKYGTGDSTYSAPAIADDGTIYFTSHDCYLHAVNPNGTMKWRFYAKGSLTSSPAVANDGTIYFGSLSPGYNGTIFAVNPNGTEKWHYQTGYWIFSDPAVKPDGTIYIGSGDGYLYAMNPNGTLRWRFATNGQIHGHPSIASDGTIYIGSYDDHLYAVFPNGTMKWNYYTGFGMSGSASIDTDGTIYVGTDKLYAIHPNGTTKWAFNLGTGHFIGDSCPAISSDGTIYIGDWVSENDNGGEIIAVNHDGVELWRKLIARNHVDSSPAIGSDGTVYIGSSTWKTLFCGILYAFGRGPLIVKANGPYQGRVDVSFNFSGTIYGGIPPYNYHWDFGDGSSSDQQNPSHSYTEEGNFTATFTVTDSEGNQSNDTASVHITYAPVSVSIIKPTRGLYIFDIRILPLPRRCIAIGPLTIEVQASQNPLGIDRVEFRVDNNLKSTVTQPPYTWQWNMGFLSHTITVTAYDTKGHYASASIQIMKLF
jgi:outer membrane protein assembly factor BamB